MCVVVKITCHLIYGANISNNTYKTLDVVFLRFRGFSFPITLRPNGVTSLLLSLSYPEVKIGRVRSLSRVIAPLGLWLRGSMSKGVHKVIGPHPPMRHAGNSFGLLP